MAHSWDELDSYRGTVFEGQWPSIPTMFSITLQKYPRRPAFTILNGQERQTLTYVEAYYEITRIAGFLQSKGLEKGDRVALNGKNSPSWALAYLATQFAGGVVVPLDNQLSSERVSALGAFSGASFLLADSDVIAKLPKDSWFKNLKSTVRLEDDPQAAFPSLCSVQSNVHFKPVKTNCDDLAAILFTSGTTGNEKGVVLTHGNFVSDVFMGGDPEFLSITEEDIFYALLPLHHSYSMTAVFLESIKHGCELIFGQGIVVSRILSDMRLGKVTLFLAIPLLYNKLLSGMLKKVREKGLAAYVLIRSMMWLNGVLRKTLGINPGRRWFKQLLEGIGMTNIKICICGGGPLSPKTFHKYQQLGIDFIQGYGLTETAPILTLNPISRFKITSVGKVFPLVEMRIADQDLLGVGEVQVKGPNICKGYYNDKPNTEALFTKDGFMHTGDLGFLDKDNYLYLKGRAKNLIVTEGGKNVYPEEIEDAFQLFNQIDQVMVRGYLEKRSERAEGIEALIYPNAEYYKQLGYSPAQIETDLQEVVSEVNRKMVAYKKVSKLTVLAKPMAMTSTKKIQRNKVGRTFDRLIGA
ncbi:MAG: long-chain fatty acid--CoA ligase [Spirochaetae bacterium HGW-Spirochaetae-8]|nr:MAG: long-chain fatty acid--CoA ligase [Spirochaetae bacterium HGW-Spirochaetae-8]